MIARFDWDAGNTWKCQQHGVSIDEIEFVLQSDPLIQPDHKHSIVEARFIAVGPNSDGRLIFIVYTRREADDGETIRPVSARYMHAKETKRYVDQRGPEGSDHDD